MSRKFQKLALVTIVLFSSVSACGVYDSVDDGAIASSQNALNRPDFNGLRMVSPRGGAVFLIMGGQKRGIISGDVYDNIFIDRNGIQMYWDISQVDDGPLMGSDTVLLRNPAGAVLLYTNGQKHGVFSSAAAAQYHFNIGKAITLPDSILNLIPYGFTL